MAGPNALRPTPPDAAEAVAALLAACDAVETSRAPTTADDMRHQWARPNFDLAADSRVAGPAGEPLTAYTDVWAPDPSEATEQRFIFGVYVHPDRRGSDPELEDAVVNWVEARAAERLAAGPAGARGQLLVSLAGADPAGQALLARHGYAVEGESRIMRRDLAAPVAAPVWPAGVSLRPMQPGLDEPAIYALVTAAFSDLPDFRPLTYERWLARMTPTDFDPRWWFLAVEPGGALIGASLCFPEGELGWCQQLAVRRDWRRRGLAQALLQHTFTEFQRAGCPAVELGVDAANATGATRVYERAGMTIAQHFVRFEKQLTNTRETAA